MIALNPQLEISDYNLTDNFIKATGFNLNEKDLLLRNDIVRRIRENGKNNSYTILFNAKSKNDMLYQALPFCKKVGINPQYGITIKDNILFWLYDCVGTPNAHISYETKSIFVFIDRLARKFADGTLTDDDKFNAIIINDNWYDYFNLKKNYNLKVSSGRFFLSGEKFFYSDWDELIDGKISIKQRDYNYNYYKLILPFEDSYYSLLIDCVTSESDLYTVAIFDFDSEYFLYKNNYNVGDLVCLNFYVRDNVKRNIGICVYAGIFGQTEGISIDINRFIVKYRSIKC